ncbi:response regulator transcription factor [Oscillatoria sp. CS-180]|uniref:two-component system response regulator RppA n=1 Tax=Oscillatoria sp. CS-180 TaxID=3021720 RepID=UPI00232CEDC0|nr:two-component system response regulator RppA [Oscillatoria sp. CS-180]MDB9528163.1 response regulator transcription factor [Oscillatoria sp. CS-180]
MRILLVDDEAELAEPLSRVLSREGYQVDVAFDGQAGRQLAAQGGYDLLILDWMLPHFSGLEVCQQVRSRGDATPVLFLTAKDTLDDRVEGLDAGADDYIVKPFELRELLARVRALLRRPPTLEAPQRPVRLQYEDLELDEANQLAYRQEQMIELSEKETRLLGYLLRHPNQVLTHTQIHQAVWKDTDEPASNVLAAQMRLLRRKIEPKGTLPLIHTVYGKGYRLGR